MVLPAGAAAPEWVTGLTLQIIAGGSQTVRSDNQPGTPKLAGRYLLDMRIAAFVVAAVLAMPAIARASRGGSHSRMDLALSGLVLDSSGHMRAFADRAVLASLLPPDVVAADVR